MQRLLVKGSYTLPSVVVVDCSAIARWNLEQDPASDPWPVLIEAIQRTPRQCFLLVGPLQKSHGSFQHHEMLALHTRLSASLPAAWSLNPAGVAVGTLKIGRPIAFVTANVTERPYELKVLERGASVVLDVASGRTFDRATAEREFGPLRDLDFLSALLTPEPGTRPIVKEAMRYAGQILERWSGLLSLPALGLPKRLKAAINDNFDELFLEARARFGLSDTDDALLVNWIRGEAVAPLPDNVCYVAASFSGGKITGVAALLSNGNFVSSFDSPMQVLNWVWRNGGNHWFAPNAMEIRHAMRLLPDPMAPTAPSSPMRRAPQVLEDPAVYAYVLNPDAPPRVEEIAHCLTDAPPGALEALNDHKRRGHFLRPEELERIVRNLPEVRVQLRQALQSQNMLQLVDDDVFKTLPALVRVEQWGMLPAPAAMRATLASQLTSLIADKADRVSVALGRDPATAPEEFVLQKIRASGFPWPAIPQGSSANDILMRLSERGSSIARDVLAISSFSAAEPWVRQIEQATKPITGRMIFGKTGRLYFSDSALHSMPKRGSVGSLIRGRLVAPDGCTLIAADWNAFEPRLLASLIGPGILFSAAQQPDFYQALAGTVSLSRDETKAAMLALMYGQGREGFVRTQHAVEPAYAETVFSIFRKALPEVRRYRLRQMSRFTATGQVRSAGGWRRIPTERQGLAVPHLPIQGFGADILRFVLRELDERLFAFGFGTGVVLQHHDEVVVVTPDRHVSDVEAELRNVMENEAPRRLGVQIPLPVRIKKGKTWEDIL